MSQHKGQKKLYNATDKDNYPNKSKDKPNESEKEHWSKMWMISKRTCKFNLIINENPDGCDDLKIPEYILFAKLKKKENIF